MSTAEATGGVLHRPKRSKHPVLHKLEKAIYTIVNSRSFPPLRVLHVLQVLPREALCDRKEQ
jgi:hypothetical protein